jgi:phosphatidylserine decarboxylase
LTELGMDQFIHDRQQPYWGFASWNAFFTRQLRPGVRPVAELHDERVIVNACEASPYNLQHDLQLRDNFWMKSQPHSLVDIFTDAHRDLAERFVGGSLYQAYLSSHNYHRWHAPISGTVERAYFVDGTYYSTLEAEGEDAAGLNDSQGYSTAVAARAIVVIAADHAPLGRVACVFVGMAEVSSCVIEALPGQHVRKGDEIGFFQYGGSTYCLLFEPDTVRDFVPKPPFDDSVPPLKINSELAKAR